MVVALQWGGGAAMGGMKADTPEETKVAMEELGPDCIRIYTDGGGPVRRARRHGGLGRARRASARGRPSGGASTALGPRRDRPDVGVVDRLIWSIGSIC